MTLAPRIDLASRAHRDGAGVTPGLVAIGLASLILAGALCATLAFGLRPMAARGGVHGRGSAPAHRDDPKCRAALDHARDTQDRPADEAIAASTAMLRACGAA